MANTRSHDRRAAGVEEQDKSERGSPTDWRRSGPTALRRAWWGVGLAVALGVGTYLASSRQQSIIRLTNHPATDLTLRQMRVQVPIPEGSAGRSLVAGVLTYHTTSPVDGTLGTWRLSHLASTPVGRDGRVTVNSTAPDSPFFGTDPTDGSSVTDRAVILIQRPEDPGNSSVSDEIAADCAALGPMKAITRDRHPAIRGMYLVGRDGTGQIVSRLPANPALTWLQPVPRAVPTDLRTYLAGHPEVAIPCGISQVNLTTQQVESGYVAGTIQWQAGALSFSDQVTPALAELMFDPGDFYIDVAPAPSSTGAHRQLLPDDLRNLILLGVVTYDQSRREFYLVRPAGMEEREQLAAALDRLEQKFSEVKQADEFRMARAFLAPGDTTVEAETLLAGLVLDNLWGVFVETSNDNVLRPHSYRAGQNYVADTLKISGDRRHELLENLMQVQDALRTFLKPLMESAGRDVPALAKAITTAGQAVAFLNIVTYTNAGIPVVTLTMPDGSTWGGIDAQLELDGAPALQPVVAVNYDVRHNTLVLTLEANPNPVPDSEGTGSAAGVEELSAEEITHRLLELPTIPGLPSNEDLLAILKAEGVRVFMPQVGELAFALLLAEQDSPGRMFAYLSDKLCRWPYLTEDLREQDKALWRSRAKGIYGRYLVISPETVLIHDPIRGVRPFDLCGQLGLTGDLENGLSQAIVLNPETYTALPRMLFEETLHLLEGCRAMTVSLPRSIVGGGLSHEVVNDLLQLLFFSEAQVAAFQSSYTDWTTDEKLALQRRYLRDLGLNPNTQMREIVAALLADIKINQPVQVQGAEVLILHLLFQKCWRRTGLTPPPWSWRNDARDTLVSYLHDLVASQHFSRYSVLFPGWRLEAPAAAGAEEMPERRAFVMIGPSVMGTAGLEELLTDLGQTTVNPQFIVLPSGIAPDDTANRLLRVLSTPNAMVTCVGLEEDSTLRQADRMLRRVGIMPRHAGPEILSPLLAQLAHGIDSVSLAGLEDSARQLLLDLSGLAQAA